MKSAARQLAARLGLIGDDGNIEKDRLEALESFLSGLVLQFLLLVTGIIAARILGELGRGQQALIWIIALTTTQIAMFGLPLALTYEAARGYSAARSLLRHVAPLGLAQIAVTLLTYLAVVTLIVNGEVPRSAALVTALALPAMVWQSYCLALIQGHHRFRALHVLRILPTGLYALALISILVAGEGSVFQVMLAWTATYIVAAMTTQVYTWRMGGEDLPVETALPSRNRMIKFGATGFLGSSTPLEIFRVDQLAVGLLLAANDLALYTTALALCNLPRFLTQALGMNAYARIARQVSVAVRWRMLGRYTALAVVTALVVSLPLGLLAEPIIKLTFGPEFAGAVTITEILLVATVILCARRILSDCLRGVGLPGAGSVAEIASLISLVPAAALLVHADGLDGFGLAMVVSYSVGLGVVILYMVRGRNADLDRPVPNDGGGQFATEIGVGDGLNELDMPKAGPEKK